MRPRIYLDEYDWRMIGLIAIMVVVNVVMILIINSISYRHSGERHTQKYLEKHGYANVEILKFSPKECECADNGGYEFRAVTANGIKITRKACSDGNSGFIIYDLYGCNQTNER